MGFNLAFEGLNKPYILDYWEIVPYKKGKV